MAQRKWAICGPIHVRKAFGSEKILNFFLFCLAFFFFNYSWWAVIFCFIYLGFGGHIWLCLGLACSREPPRMSRIESGLNVCKASSLPTVLSLHLTIGYNSMYHFYFYFQPYVAVLRDHSWQVQGTIWGVGAQTLMIQVHTQTLMILHTELSLQPQALSILIVPLEK